MHGSYNRPLVALSIAIAVVASYAALDLAARVTAARGRERLAWLAGGSIALGTGIWSMHFVGMLAFRLPMPVTYDTWLLVLSVVVAIVASALALFVVSLEAVGLLALVPAGLFMGPAIAGMHYVGMAAMRMPATIEFRGALVTASVAIAITASIAGLWLAFRFRYDETRLGRWRSLGKGAAAGFMGAAISGMHYTGMSAAHFLPGPLPPSSPGHVVIASSELAIAVIMATGVILGTALLGAMMDRQLKLKSAEAETQRLLAEASRAANQAKTEFLAMMSHELRTPLNAIAGYTELLELELRGPITEAQREDLRRIRRNQQHLLSLINDILNYATIEAGQVKFRIANVPIAEILADAEALIAPQLRDKGLRYSCKGCDADVHVRADAEKARQVVLNLLSNAVKFTDRGGAVTVTCEATDNVIVVRVIDTGRGVPADKLDRIFEPFVQVDRGLTRNTEGTGLGLAISLDLARSMGGDLTVSSVLAQGSTFIFTLPRGEGTTALRTA